MVACSSISESKDYYILHVSKRITQFYLPPTWTIHAFTPQPQSIAALWLVLIAPTHGGMARLSWPGWLVICWDRFPAPGVEPRTGHPSQYWLGPGLVLVLQVYIFSDTKEQYLQLPDVFHGLFIRKLCLQPGSAPDPAVGAYSAPRRPSCIEGGCFMAGWYETKGNKHHRK